ncbi:MAG: GNAT family N-acetyltransferase [Pseudomonadota bacterium]|jgi:putative hemolysin
MTTNAHESRLKVQLAAHADDIQRSQRLRHQVFVEEMGCKAQVENGLEFDRYDPFCHHLLVIDQDSDTVVASTRILTDTQARAAGGFYSANEFDMDMIHHLPGRVMEIGRTCVHPEHRNGATIGMLWQGLARFMEIHHIGHLFGCASIPMHDGGLVARQIMDELREKHLSPEDQRVVPRLPLPRIDAAVQADGKVRMPPLLKAYMRLGAQICGEPCWDPEFGCADIFILLDVDRLQARYHRHFVLRQAPIQHEARPAALEVA